MRTVSFPLVLFWYAEDGPEDTTVFAFNPGATEAEQVQAVFEQFSEDMADDETTPKTWEDLDRYLATIGDYYYRRETREIQV